VIDCVGRLAFSCARMFRDRFATGMLCARLAVTSAAA
jgi:hypothetical protein